MTQEKNDKGQILVDPSELVKTAGCKDSNYRYNGGWSKLVTGLNKATTDGYSILGGFLKDGKPYWIAPGSVILDCNISGSRKHPSKFYRVIRVLQDGTGELLATAQDDKKWAVNLWPVIEQALADQAAVEQAPPGVEERLAIAVARREELLKELAQLDEEIARLTIYKQANEDVQKIKS